MGCSSSSATPTPPTPSSPKSPSPPPSSAPPVRCSSSPLTVIGKDQPITTYEDQESQVLTAPPPVTLSRDDFGDFTYIQCGGAGKVYLAPRISDGKLFAMKFFGYTSKKPIGEEIEREIQLMQSLLGIPNVVQLEGIFHDSLEGYVPGRIYEEAFPVIVMEALLGGDLFERLRAPGDQMTERFLSTAFRGVIEALHQIHLRGFIHRDLKLENLIYESKDSSSAIKVVDFGMMKKIRSPEGIYVSLRVEGTAGYCAPESYLYRIYGAKSDLWQAGCCLYSMLSGNAAFPQDNPERVKAALYAPMTGVAWSSISEPAKDLIRKILVKDPLKRCTVEEILGHPWLQPGIAPERELDDGYRTRIYKLALRNRMKTLFLNDDLQKTCKMRRELLMNTLPFLKNHENSSVSLQNILSGEELKDTLSMNPSDPLPNLSSSPASPSSNQFIQQKLRYLKSGLFHAPSPLSPTKNLSHHEDIPPVRISSATLAEEESTITIVPRRTSDSVIFRPRTSTTSSSWRNINLSQITYQDFLVIMNKVDLPQLATLPVFHIFEKGSTGVMDMKEFLLTILTIYPHSPDPLHLLELIPSAEMATSDNDPVTTTGPDIHPARLFFDFFDLKETGYIDLEELKLIVGCLLADEMTQGSSSSATPLETTDPITVENVEDLFHTIDQNQSGKIDFQEFLNFFETILRSPTLFPSSGSRHLSS